MYIDYVSSLERSHRVSSNGRRSTILCSGPPIRLINLGRDSNKVSITYNSSGTSSTINIKRFIPPSS